MPGRPRRVWRTSLNALILVESGLSAALPISLVQRPTHYGRGVFKMGGSAALSQGTTKWNPPASSQASSVTITQTLSKQAPWMQQASSRLDELKHLAPDWDGYKS